MSAANRSESRVAFDVYPTPAWCVHRLLEEVELPGGHWCEPAAGDGAIIRAVRDVRRDVTWSALELRSECQAALVKEGAEVQIGDALESPWQLRPELLTLVITNPPYALAEAFLARALEASTSVALLLRLDFLGSERRSGLFRRVPPDIHVLPNRPSFVAGRTDASEYAWFVWRHYRDRRYGNVGVLATTPREVRIPRRAPVTHAAPTGA